MSAAETVGAAALVVLAVLVVALWLRVTSLGREVHRLRTDRPVGHGDLAALRADLSEALRHVAVVRYDAFGDMGGRLSWSMALVDDAGNGVVLTSIHGRSEARSYAKNINEWKCEQAMSPEEHEALGLAKAA